jgi:CRISPR-associated endonuclease/helicase Cas3
MGCIQKRKFERVFYFSPLLALTEDFEKKLARTTKNQEDILIYNHIFSGSLLEKAERTQRESGLFDLYHWYFKYESFNKKFIITTTQRLLITLYSNKASDKLKLLSMKNSILILDEIQTLPKFLIPNLIEMLKEFTKFMKSKVLLVSATIPYELSSLPKIEISPNIRMDYLRRTQKKILFIGNSFSIPDFHGKKILLMSNTRRKAREMFRKVEYSYRPQSESKRDLNNERIFYISSGIRKKDRVRIIKALTSEEVENQAPGAWHS